MIWYLLIATFLFCGYFTKKPKRYYIISLILLFIFTGFRDITLGDYNNTAYIHAFNVVDTLPNFSFSKDYPFELGFMLFNSICKTVCNDFRFFQVVYSFVAIFLLHLVIKKMKINNKQKCMFLFVYFCMRFLINNWIILRQNIALLLIWNILLTEKLPIKQTITKKVVPFLISCYFHVTSIFNAIGLFIIHKLKLFNQRIMYFWTIIISFIFLFSGTRLFTPLMNVMIQVGGDKFESYISADTAEFNLIYYFIRIAILTFLFLFYQQIKYEKKDLLFSINVMAVVVGSINVAIFSRFMEYLMIGPYLIIAISADSFDLENRKIYLFIFYIFMVVILIRSLVTYSGGLFMMYDLFF